MASPTFDMVIDHEDVALSVADGTGTPVTLALNLEDASLGITGLQGGNVAQATVPGVRRGKVRSLHRGERTFPQISLTGKTTGIDQNELHNFILRRGTYNANVSTAGANQKVYCIDLVAAVAQWDGTTKVVTLKQCHFTVDFSEQDNAELNVSYSGVCYGEMLVTGSDAMQTERT